MLPTDPQTRQLTLAHTHTPMATAHPDDDDDDVSPIPQLKVLASTSLNLWDVPEKITIQAQSWIRLYCKLVSADQSIVSVLCVKQSCSIELKTVLLRMYG